MYVTFNLLNFFSLLLTVDALPKECCVHYKQALKGGSGWEKVVEHGGTYYKKLLTAETDTEIVTKCVRLFFVQCVLVVSEF